MANGIFLGGVAEGMKSAEEAGLKRDALAQELGLRTRGLDLQEQGLSLREKGMEQELGLRTRALNIQEQGQKNAQSRALLTLADKSVSETMEVVAETITQGLAAGRDPAQVAKAVQPMVASAKRIATKGGLDPNAIDIRVNALMARPGLGEVSRAAGTAKAEKTIAERKAMDAAGITSVDKETSQLENVLRDDYAKASADFIKVRDAKNRIDSISDTAAGDVALTFSFLKVLDPGSTVREGEFATVQNSQGVPDQVRAAYNQALTGERLPPNLRNDIRTQANALYKAAATQHEKLTGQYKSIAERQGLNPKNIVIDLTPDAAPNGSGAGDIPPPPPGFQIVK